MDPIFPSGERFYKKKPVTAVTGGNFDVFYYLLPADDRQILKGVAH